jgi:hypothetical protein
MRSDRSMPKSSVVWMPESESHSNSQRHLFGARLSDQCGVTNSLIICYAVMWRRAESSTLGEMSIIARPSALMGGFSALS